jgi:hypothetical protein
MPDEKKLHNFDPKTQCYKTYFRINNIRDKLECLSK